MILVSGAAGVGKTRLLREARDAAKANGHQFFAFAPSTAASHVALRGEGFSDADTLASLLVNPKVQERVRGGVLLIDEAGMVSSRTMRELFELSEKFDCRVLLVADEKQHGSVERGAVLRLLQDEAGLPSAEVKEIKRQELKAYKEVVKALSEGRVADGFRKLDDLGWIKEIAGDDRYRQMASDYVETILRGREALCVSPTHIEKNHITANIRHELKERGRLGRKERSFTLLRNSNLTEAQRGDEAQYSENDVLVFHQNAKGHERGQRVVLENGIKPPLDQARRFQVFHASTIDLAKGDLVRITRNGFSLDGKHRLTNGATYRVKDFDAEGNIVFSNGWVIGKDWGFLDYGYVVTSHASQGRTIDGEVFIGQSRESYGASSMEQFYVSVSRAKHRLTIYADNKLDLLKAVERPEDRTTATEFINDLPPQQLSSPERVREMHREPEREQELIRD